MANEFVVRKGLIVKGSGSSTVLDVQGSQGQLFSITDSLSGSIFSANDISGIPVIEAFSDNTVKLGTFGAEGIIVSGSFALITGSLFGTSSWANNSTTSSFSTTASYVNPLRQDVEISGSLRVTGSGNHYIVGGNIGINKINPTNPLDVVGTTFISGGLFTRGAGIFINSNENYGSTNLYTTFGYISGEFLIRPSGSNSQFLFSPNGGVNIGASDGYNIAGSSGSPPERGLAVSGSVAIGRRTANTKVHIDTDGAGLLVEAAGVSPFSQNIAEFKYKGNGNSIIINNISGQAGFTTSTNMNLNFAPNGTGLNSFRDGKEIRLNNSSNNGFLGLINNGATGQARLDFITGSTTIMSISGSGFVGIGTPTPGVRLDVNGDIRSSLTMYNSATQTQKIRINSTTQLTFENTGSVEIARVTNAGNWGFGTTNPTEKVHVVGNGLFTGDLTVQGRLTAEEFYTEYVSGSIIYESGSTKFGDTLDDTHQFTGSLQVSGSITGSLFGTSSYAVSSSYAITASYANVAAEVLNPYYAVFTQSVASTTWTFNHNLGQRTPVITIYDNNYKVVIPESIQGTSQNQTVITFSSPQSGYASATMGSVLPSNQESLALVYAIVL